MKATRAARRPESPERTAAVVLKSDSATGLLAGLAAASIWGAMYVVSKAVMATIPPLTLLLLRLVLGAVALLPWVLRTQAWWPGTAWVLRALAVGAVGYGLSLGLQFVGTDLSTAANGAVITAATPAFVGVFAAWLLREPLGPRERWALLLATVGALLVADPARATWGSRQMWGDALLFLAAVTWALYSVLVRGLTRHLPVLTVTWWTFWGGVLLVLPGSGWELQSRSMGAWTPGVWAGVLFLGWVSTALAMYLWNLAFARVPAALAGLTFFAQPVVGTLLSMAFLGERPTAWFFVGAAGIGLGLYLATTGSQRGSG